MKTNTINEIYLKSIDKYIADEEKRGEVFEYLGKSLKSGIESGKRNEFMWVIREIINFIEGTGALFSLNVFPDRSVLLKKKEIRDSAILFLRNNFDLIVEASLKTKFADDEIDILYLLIKYTKDIKDVNVIHFIKLYTLLAYTFYRINDLNGEEKTKKTLLEIILKGFKRYDAFDFIKEFYKEYLRFNFIEDEELKRIFESIEKLEIYDEFWEFLKEKEEEYFNIVKLVGYEEITTSDNKYRDVIIYPLFISFTSFGFGYFQAYIEKHEFEIDRRVIEYGFDKGKKYISGFFLRRVNDENVFLKFFDDKVVPLLREKVKKL